MGDSNSGIPWTQDALTELHTLAVRWQLTDDQVLNLRREAEAPAFMEVTPSDVRAAWDHHRPKLYPRPVSWPVSWPVSRPGEGEPSTTATADPAPVAPEVPEVPEVPRTLTIPRDDGRGNIGETVALDRAGEARLPAARYAELKLLESIAWSADSIARKLGALVDAQRTR